MDGDRVVLAGVEFEVTSADDVGDDSTCLEFRRADSRGAVADIEVCQRGDEGSADATVSMGGTLDIAVVEAVLVYARDRLVIPEQDCSDPTASA